MIGLNPFSHPIIIGVLGLVLASGGIYGGYRVMQDDGEYGVDFERRLHDVTAVVDGDTFVVTRVADREDGGSKKNVNTKDIETRVRLLGIDAPEIGECYGAEAKRELARLLAGQKVVLVKDESGVDGYGRLLRYALVRSEHPEVDDVFVTAEIVRRGAAQARYVTPNKMYNLRISAAEAEAREAGRGMWTKCSYKSESDVRREDRQEASATFSKECVIKGNTGRWGKTYLLPGCPNYERSKVDTSRGERWFCTEKEAKDAGWERSNGCKNLHQFD